MFRNIPTLITRGPKGPCSYMVYTWDLEQEYVNPFGPSVYTIYLHGHSGKLPSQDFPILNPQPSSIVFHKLHGAFLMMVYDGPLSLTIHVRRPMLLGNPQEDRGLKCKSPHNLSPSRIPTKPAGLLLVKELRLRHHAEEAMLFTMECISG